MIKYFFEPDEKIEIGVYSDDRNHSDIINKVSDILGYSFEPGHDVDITLDVDDISLDRDVVIFYRHIFTEELLDLTSDGIGVYIVK